MCIFFLSSLLFSSLLFSNWRIIKKTNPKKEKEFNSSHFQACLCRSWHDDDIMDTHILHSSTSEKSSTRSYKLLALWQYVWVIVMNFLLNFVYNNWQAFDFFCFGWQEYTLFVARDCIFLMNQILSQGLKCPFWSHIEAITTANLRVNKN